jgi:hypothetical protein
MERIRDEFDKMLLSDEPSPATLLHLIRRIEKIIEDAPAVNEKPALLGIAEKLR